MEQIRTEGLDCRLSSMLISQSSATACQYSPAIGHRVARRLLSDPAYYVLLSPWFALSIKRHSSHVKRSRPHLDKSLSCVS